MCVHDRVHARVRDVFVNVFETVVMFTELTEYQTEYHMRHPRQNRNLIYSFELAISFDLSIYVS